MLMIIIDSAYIRLPREERLSHIDLNDECLERGGISTNHKGVLAQYLNSSIPSGRLLLCHACNNGACSNPKHLYWGTDHDNNVVDGAKYGSWKTPWERLVEKHGLEEAKRLQAVNANGSPGGRANKGVPKSEEHKRKLSEAATRRHASLVKSADTGSLNGPA